MSACVEKILLTELEKALDVPLDQIKNLENFNNHGMDSLGFALFIFNIEDELNIRFEPEELELKNLKNFESIKNLVENKIIKAKDLVDKMGIAEYERFNILHFYLLNVEPSDSSNSEVINEFVNCNGLEVSVYNTRHPLNNRFKKYSL